MPQQQYYQSGGRGGASSSSAAADAAGATLRSPKGPSPPPLHYHHRHGTNLPILEGDDDKAALEADADSRRPLTFWPLLALIYYTSSGGPFGIEPIVGSVGPLLSIVGYLVFPVVWYVEQSLAQLGSLPSSLRATSPQQLRNMPAALFVFCLTPPPPFFFGYDVKT